MQAGRQTKNDANAETICRNEKRLKEHYTEKMIEVGTAVQEGRFKKGNERRRGKNESG